MSDPFDILYWIKNPSHWWFACQQSAGDNYPFNQTVRLEKGTEEYNDFCEEYNVFLEE